MRVKNRANIKDNSIMWIPWPNEFQIEVHRRARFRLRFDLRQTELLRQS